MMHAYVGLADRNGLKAFAPESESVVRRYCRQAQDEQRQVAIWSVLESNDLAIIDSLLELAEYAIAWKYLQSHATFFGRLV